MNVVIISGWADAILIFEHWSALQTNVEYGTELGVLKNTAKGV
jgi:hypothetical protein